MIGKTYTPEEVAKAKELICNKCGKNVLTNPLQRALPNGWVRVNLTGFPRRLAYHCCECDMEENPTTHEVFATAPDSLQRTGKD